MSDSRDTAMGSRASGSRQRPSTAASRHGGHWLSTSPIRPPREALVIVVGKLRSRKYTDQNYVNRTTGEPMTRTVTEIQADDIAISLRCSAANVINGPVGASQEATDAQDMDIAKWNEPARRRAEARNGRGA